MSNFKNPQRQIKLEKQAAARQLNLADKQPPAVEVQPHGKMSEEMKLFLSRAASETSGIFEKILLTPPSISFHDL